MVLDPVDPSAQGVVLQVQQLEAREQILDEPADPEGEVDVAHRHRVHREAAKLLGDIGHSQQVLLDGDVEGISILDVDGNW